MSDGRAFGMGRANLLFMVSALSTVISVTPDSQTLLFQ
jgi:hypothetical protein